MVLKQCVDCAFWHPEKGSSWGRCSAVEIPSTYVKIVSPEPDIASLKTHKFFYCSLFKRWDPWTLDSLPLEVAKLTRKRV